MFCPKELGGAELSFRLYFLCWEALNYRYGAPVHQFPYFIISSFSSGPHENWLFASERLRREVLPGLSGGILQGAFGLTEPDAGSDPWMMKTAAVRAGSDWIINGSKQWTSWSPTADFIMVYAITDKELVAQRRGGITCFYVPTSTPGYRFESVLKVFGQIGGDEGILSFTDVRVPDDYRVGEEGHGFALAMRGVRHGRLNHAGRSLGLSRWALEKAVAYSQIRRTFGKRLCEHQTIQNYLVECAMKLYAARCMALDCTTKADAGRDLRSEISLLKVFCTETVNEIIDKCMHIHGGMGLANETHLYDALFLARIMRTAEGANEIQFRSVANSLVRGELDLSFS